VRATPREALALGLETLVEVHTEAELKTAQECEGAIVGVNSRDLATLKTDLAVALRLAPLLPPFRPTDRGERHPQRR